MHALEIRRLSYKKHKQDRKEKKALKERYTFSLSEFQSVLKKSKL